MVTASARKTGRIATAHLASMCAHWTGKRTPILAGIARVFSLPARAALFGRVPGMDATPIPAAPRETFGLAARGRAAPAAIAGFGRPGARMSGDGGHLTAHRFGAGHLIR